MRSALSLPHVTLLAWIALTGGLMWLALSGAIEPPAWDSLSYVQKGFLFWQSVTAGVPFNPLDLAPTLRPPGSVLMSYPFGFDPDFRGFYFRSSFIPQLLYVGAVIVVGAGTRTQQWVITALAIVLAGMPMLFQFQPNDQVPWEVTWGMVDNFLASLSAFAAAAVLRSIKTQSIGWLCVAAIFASLGFLVKPSGVLVMALIAGSWLALLWNAELSAAQKTKLFAFGALAGTAIYGVVLIVVQQSQYFSTENILFGNRALEVMNTDNPMALSLAELEGWLRISLGYPALIVIAAGLILSSARKMTVGHAVAALASLVVGVWFWYFKTQPWEPRYFVPFAAMAFVFTMPTLLSAATNVSRRTLTACLSLLVLPAAATTFMLAMSSLPLSLQRTLGVNLAVNVFAPENQQAESLFKALKDFGVTSSTVYAFDISSPIRSFQAVLNYENLTKPLSPNVQFLSPIDWQRPNAYRFDELASASYFLFEPVGDDQKLHEILQRRQVKDFYEEKSLMNAWASTLGEAQGVTIVSETSLRLVKIVDVQKFEVAFDQLVREHDWPTAFLASNPQRWWSDQELAALKSSSRVVHENIAYRAESSDSITIPAVVMARQPTSVEVDVWLSAGSMSQSSRPWTLFGHLVDDSGAIYGNAQFALSVTRSPYPDRPFRRLTLRYNLLEPKASAIALGVFAKNGETMDFMIANDGPRDWDGRRVILPLPSPQNAAQ